MSLFLSGLPLWITAILLVVIPTIIACCGLILVRRHVGLERLTTNNEVAGFKFAVVGVIYAVLMAFAIVVVWQRYTDAELAVVSEAGAAATLYRLAAGPEPEARELRRALAAYLTLAIEVEWPQMAHEEESAEANRGLDVLYAAALHMGQTALRPPAVLLPIFNQIDLITEARRSRLHLAIGIMPGVLWAALILGGGLTAGFTYFFGTENLKAQVMMSAILAIIVFMGLFVIVAIDHPFTGPVHIDPGPLQRVLSDFRS